ncbi:MAG TPA: glycosyltransferase [Candidatus Binataceae bacterium]|nr:glycosyltransferase [Candidatus Binataceae bacterium]
MRVSVVTPVYNGARTLKRALDSALAQEFDDFEVIVVNDGSTDSTASILAGYGDRIRVIDQPRGGCSAASNTGCRAARGEFVAWIDADDIWMPNKLALTVPPLELDPECVLVFSNARKFLETGETLSDFVSPELAHAPTLDEMLTHLWPIISTTAVARRRVLEEVEYFFARPGFYHICSDIDAWLRLRELGHFHYVPETLAMYSTRPFPQNVGQYRGDQKYAFRRIAKRYGARGRRMARNVRAEQRAYNVNQLGYLGLLAMREGRSAEARRHFIHALRCDPFSIKNALRVMRSFLPARLAQRLTGRSRFA